MEYSYKCGMRVRYVLKKTVVTSSTTTTSSESKSGRYLVRIEINCNRQPFPRHDVKLFPIEAYTTMSSESFSYKSINNNCSSVYERLKYPGDSSPRKKEAEDKVNEIKILPEVVKQDKQVILVLPAEEEDEEDDDDEEESEEEYDEFEEEIVVVDVRRKPFWRKGLEIPKPQPEKVGIPVEELLEIPTLQAKQESAPDELLIDEKIESVERPPVVYAELPDLGILDNL